MNVHKWSVYCDACRRDVVVEVQMLTPRPHYAQKGADAWYAALRREAEARFEREHVPMHAASRRALASSDVSADRVTGPENGERVDGSASEAAS